MAYNIELAKRVGAALSYRKDLVEKKMMGGLTFMLNDKMAAGIINDDLMIRVMPEKYEALLALPHTKQMDFTGRVLKGFIQVEPPGFESEEQLQALLEYGIEFAEKGELKNPKKKKAK